MRTSQVPISIHPTAPRERKTRNEPISQSACYSFPSISVLAVVFVILHVFGLVYRFFLTAHPLPWAWPVPILPSPKESLHSAFSTYRTQQPTAPASNCLPAAPSRSK
jgi:hypothetical protein